MLFELASQERKNNVLALFTAVALFGCTSLRRLEDVGNKQANQSALLKAFASSNPRLTAGPEARSSASEGSRAVQTTSGAHERLLLLRYDFAC
jgi:hypothetical protein